MQDAQRVAFFRSFGVAEQVAPSLAATEHRGITIAQLDTIVDAIKEHADADGNLPGWTDINGKTCHKDTVNLYPLSFRLRWKSREIKRTSRGDEKVGRRSIPNWVGHFWKTCEGNHCDSMQQCTDSSVRVLVTSTMVAYRRSFLGGLRSTDSLTQGAFRRAVPTDIVS